MAETPPGGPSYGQSASGFPGAPGQFSGVPSGPPSWASSAPRGASRLLTLVSLGISLIAIVLAIVGWLRPVHAGPSPSPSPGPSPSTSGSTFTEQQISDAKTSVCNEFATVKKVISGNTHRVNPVPGDQVGDLATGIYAPVSVYDSGDYLERVLSDNSATPADLKNSLESFSRRLFKFAMNDLAGEPDSVRDSLKHQLDSDVTTIEDLCK